MRFATVVGTLLWESVCICKQTRTHTYVSHISGEDSKEADMASQLMCMTVSTFVRDFKYTLPQGKLAGFASCFAQQSGGFLPCCTPSCCHRFICSHTAKILHSMASMGNLLDMLVHPHQPGSNQRPHALPKNSSREVLGRSARSQPTSHPKEQSGAIPLLHWVKQKSVETSNPRHNTVGSLDFRLLQ